MQIATIVLLGIIVAQLAFIILVLQVEAGNIRDFLHAIGETDKANGDLLAKMVIKGIDWAVPSYSRKGT